MNRTVADFIVVGSGIAGLTTALSLGESGHVIVLTKAGGKSGNSWRAQGGIAAAVGKDDSPSLHLQDTLRTGVGLCDPVSAEVMVNMAPSTIRLLAEWGTRFDRNGDGWALAREGSHSVSRILHVKGDATGAGITGALLKRAKSHGNIEMKTHTMVADLIVKDGTCRGVVAVDQGRSTPAVYVARKGVVLATGGSGQVYRYTTNDLGSTGDGFAMAYRAGVQLTDMEFVQFHPTALAVDQNPMFLVSEAVRGEGAILVNDRGEAFMHRYHEWKDLAPRDVVSRAIYTEMSEGRTVFLDASPIRDRFRERFPSIYGECVRHGITPGVDLIPVTPAAHFIMGGIRTDQSGRTTLPGLFACGEVACTGVHGANRLASNSLLEGAVFARRVAECLNAMPVRSTDIGDVVWTGLCNDKHDEEAIKDEIRDIMWEYAGIVRSGESLRLGKEKLAMLRSRIREGMLECENMLTVAQMIVDSALWREESRGGHYRGDFPQSIPDWGMRHHVIQRGTVHESH